MSTSSCDAGVRSLAAAVINQANMDCWFRSEASIDAYAWIVFKLPSMRLMCRILDLDPSIVARRFTEKWGANIEAALPRLYKDYSVDIDPMLRLSNPQLLSVFADAGERITRWDEHTADEVYGQRLRERIKDERRKQRAASWVLCARSRGWRQHRTLGAATSCM